MKERLAGWNNLWVGTGVALFVFLLAGVFVWMIWQQNDRDLRSEFLRQAQRSALAIDLKLVKALSGDEADLLKPEYQALKRQLMHTHQVYPQSRFLYLMGQKPGGEVVFFIDSETPGSTDESLPGQVYRDVTAPLLEVFSRRQALIEGPETDEWGVWVSALVPLVDPFTGEMLAVYGMDIEAGNWTRLIMERMLTTLVFTALLAILLITSIGLMHWRTRLPSQLQRRWWLNRAEVGIALILGLVTTGLIATLAHENEERSRFETFENLAAARSSFVATHFHELEDHQLEGLARFFESSQYVDREEFAIYTAALAGDPTVQAWEWIPLVPADELPSFVARLRQEGLSGFFVWELDESYERIPVQQREVYYPVVYIAPLEGNENVMGFDLGSEPARRQALEAAVRSGTTTATDPITLVQKTEGQVGALVFRPVFARAGKNTQTGFVTAALRMETLLKGALGPINEDEPLVFMDLYQLKLGNRPILLAGNAPDHIIEAHIHGDLHDHPYEDFTYIQPVHAFGKIYTVIVHPGPLFNKIYPQKAGRDTAIFGILITSLVTSLTYIVVTRREVLTRLVAERTAELAESEANYRELFEAESDALFLIDNQTGRILQANHAASLLYGYTREELLALKNTDLSAEPEKTRQKTQEVKPDPNKVVRIPLRWHKHKDGSVFPVEITASVYERKGRLVHIAAIRDISERVRAEERLRLQSAALHSAANAIIITDLEGVILWANPAFEELTGYSLEETLGRNPRDLVKSGLQSQSFYRTLWRTIKSGQTWHGELINQKKDGSRYIEEMTVTPVVSETGEVLNFIAIIQDISERKQRERELEAIAALSASLRTASTRAEMEPIVLDHINGLVDADGVALVLRDRLTGESVVTGARGEFAEGLRMRVPAREGISGIVITGRKPFVTADISQEPGVLWSQAFEKVRAVACIPLVVETQGIGALWVGRKTEISPTEVRLLTSIADIAANAIHRETLREDALKQVERLATLRAIDQVLTSNVDIHVILKFILEQVVAQLKVDAAAALLFNPHTLHLEYAQGRGFLTRQIETTSLRLGEGLTGRVPLDQVSLCLPDIPADKLQRESLVVMEGFVSYFATPFVVKGQVKGVLEVFQRSRLEPEADWLNYFETLAGQTAIAIDNAQLFEGLQRSNIELKVAYDATIEGWSRAMDLRDADTEGHTRRVTELAARLAQAAGMSADELVHFRRGALLHDIGKLGVPDSILLKPGPLDEKEWEMMRCHPQQAYEMLSPIDYLQPALDIPYCHHEKWDGSGYPRGLKGEQIPLAARIFAVVDVFDALTSDRPYRPAWSKEKALAYIREQSGRHFDPQIVEMFFKIIASSD